MNRLLLTAAVLFALIAAVAGVAWWQYQRFLDTPLDLPEQGTIFQVEPGATGQAIVRDLAAAGYARPGWQWRLLMRLEPRVYRSGEYRRPRILYAVQAGVDPPAVVLFVAGGELGADYLRFVENRLRGEFDFRGTTVHLVARARRPRDRS